MHPSDAFGATCAAGGSLGRVRRRRRRTFAPRAQLELAEAEALIRAALEEEALLSDAARFVLERGRALRPAERPADVPAGEARQTFRNAYRLARERGLAYWEGYSLPRGWTDRPNRHAWCVDAAGSVVDPTPMFAEPGKPLRDCYLGVELPLELAAPYAGEGEAPKGVLYEHTGRIGELAARLA
jgi:hypothetical protein